MISRAPDRFDLLMNGLMDVSTPRDVRAALTDQVVVEGRKLQAEKDREIAQGDLSSLIAEVDHLFARATLHPQSPAIAAWFEARGTDYRWCDEATLRALIGTLEKGLADKSPKWRSAAIRCAWYLRKQYPRSRRWPWATPIARGFKEINPRPSKEAFAAFLAQMGGQPWPAPLRLSPTTRHKKSGPEAATNNKKRLGLSFSS